LFSIIIFFLIEPGVIAKSSVVLDVKPWDDETDMQEMEKQVRAIVMDGLVWGACESICSLMSHLNFLIHKFCFNFSKIRSSRVRYQKTTDRYGY